MKIDMIEYTFQVKTVEFKLRLPKFISSWDSVNEQALKFVKENRVIGAEELECTNTREYIDYVGEGG